MDTPKISKNKNKNVCYNLRVCRDSKHLSNSRPLFFCGSNLGPKIGCYLHLFTIQILKILRAIWVFKKPIPGCRSHRLLHLLGLLGMDGLQQHTLVLVDVAWALLFFLNDGT